MEKKEALYEGKAKILYATEDPDLLIQYFKDDATAFNAQKTGTITEKGVMNNKITEVTFKYLESKNIPTHLVEVLNEREMLIKNSEIVPVEVIMRNRIAGSLARLLQQDEGGELACPLLEFSYKKDELGDPMISGHHIIALGLATKEDLDVMSQYAYQINDAMVEFFKKLDLELVDFKIEFGKHKGQIILADEISPDTCRLWEYGTGKKLDKDRFRHDLGDVEEAYQDVFKRVTNQ